MTTSPKPQPSTGSFLQAQPEKPNSPYRAVPFFNRTEEAFFLFIQGITGSKYRVMAKVRLWDLIDVKKGIDQEAAHKNRISSKHVDFVILEASTNKPVMAIEVDGSSHESEKRIVRDVFVNESLENAGIRVIRVPAKLSYTADDLRPGNRLR